MATAQLGIGHSVGGRGIDDVSESTTLFDQDEEETSKQALFEQGLSEIRDVITCLLRFSMTLRNPAHHDQLKQAATTSAGYYEPYDIKHVKEKFPSAPEYLHRRIGKAISKQRQYFKYREGHHQRLTEGLDDTGEIDDALPSTVATPVVKSHTANYNMITMDPRDEAESVYTATSFASTALGDAYLKPPQLPEAGQAGQPFECPLCYGIIAVPDERSWR